MNTRRWCGERQQVQREDCRVALRAIAEPAGSVVGILLVGRVLWRFIASSISIPSEPDVELLKPAAVVVAAFFVSQLVTWIATRRLLRLRPAELLRAE